MWQVRGAKRVAALQRFIDLAEAAVTAGAKAPETHFASRRVFSALRLRAGPAGNVEPRRIKVCRHIEPALAQAGRTAALAELCQAFAEIEPRLRWERRRNADPANQPFFGGHANANLVGLNGLEERDDAWIGVSLMAPGVTYVDHDHPPEEVYLALTPGEWWNEDMDWTDPGAGGTIYNRRGVKHAMRSGEGPFLALWFLPID